MINDFGIGKVAWFEWYTLSDNTGEPNHVGSFYMALEHRNTNTIKLTYIYPNYYISHVSKLVLSGAKKNLYRCHGKSFEPTYFKKSDRSIVVVASIDCENSLEYMLTINNLTAKLNMPAH